MKLERHRPAEQEHQAGHLVQSLPPGEVVSADGERSGRGRGGPTVMLTLDPR
ncbi:hypothetical protein P8605_08880 [Streptomyces sp. T-3]|nr:hypothetical protein [Streptomyces sp. T-3]